MALDAYRGRELELGAPQRGPKGKHSLPLQVVRNVSDTQTVELPRETLA